MQLELLRESTSGINRTRRTSIHEKYIYLLSVDVKLLDMRKCGERAFVSNARRYRYNVFPILLLISLFRNKYSPFSVSVNLLKGYYFIRFLLCRHKYEVKSNKYVYLENDRL